MAITKGNYFQHSTASLESALAVMDTDSELYELIQDEIDKRELESELFGPQDDTPSLQDRGLNLGSYGS